MKRKLIGLLIVSSSFVFASNFVVKIDKKNYEEKKGYSEIVSYTDWVNVGEQSCSSDITNDEIYYNFDFVKTTNCSQTQTRIKTVTKKYKDQEQTETVEENRIDINISTSNEKGTHLESNCKKILDLGYSKGDGYYYINPISNQFSAYCDMTTDGGGWTRIVSNFKIFDGNISSVADYKNAVNGIFGNGVDKYIKYTIESTKNIYYHRKTTYTYNFYDDFLATFRNYQNIINTNFTMNSNYNNLVNDINNYQFCNFSNEPNPEHTLVGFPRDCGQTGVEGGLWLTMDTARDSGHAPFSSYKKEIKLWIK